MRVSVLGPLAVTRADGTPVALGARKQRELVALLAVEYGAVVTADALADRLWRGAPPRSWQVTLQGYVHRVRRALGPDAAALAAAGGGYRLDPVEVDAEAARTEIDRGRRLLDGDDPAGATEVLGAALGRWRGPVLAEVTDIPGVEAVVAGLEELRLDAEQLRARALLAAGRHEEALPRLRESAAAHPLREVLAELLALALYRAGRPSESLAVLRALADRLRDELGVDPSPSVVALQSAVLHHDPTLRHPTAPPRDSRPEPVASGPPGRDRELAALGRAWGEARAGVAAAVLTGEAGVGKTTLLDALARDVQAAGGQVLRARGTEAEGAPPFWCWRRLVGLDPEPGTSRFAVASEIVGRLHRRAADGPVLVVLDDLHGVDPDSLAVLGTVVEQLGGAPVLFAVGARSGAQPPGLPVALAGLARHPGIRLDLGPLDDDAVRALLAARGVDDDDLAGRIARRSGGNPFLARELADLAVSGRDPATGLPGAVRDVVAARIAVLPGHVLAALETAAVAGREPGAVLTAAELDALHEAGFLTAVSGRAAFTHDLLRDAVLDGLSPQRRAALHTAVADALVGGSTHSDDVAAIAVHRSAAADGRPDAGAARACLDAARQALASGGEEDAHGLATRGLAHADSDALREELWRVGAAALVRAGRLDEAEALRDAEAASARSRGDWARLADVGLAAHPPGLGGYWTHHGAALLGSDTLLQEALDHAGELDGRRRCAVHAAEAVRRCAIGAPGAAELAAAAEALVPDAGSAEEMRTASAAAEIAGILARWGPATVATRLIRAERLVVRSAGDPEMEPTALHLARIAQLEAGRLAACRRTSRRFADLAAARPDPDLALTQAEWQCMSDLLRGNHASAQARVAGMAARMGSLAPAAATVLGISQATAAGISAWQEGRLGELVTTAESVALDGDEDFRLVTALGLAQGRSYAAAVDLVEHLLTGLDTSVGPRATIRIALLTETLVTLLAGDPGPEVRRTAADHLDRLAPAVETWEDGMVVFWPGTVCLGPAALVRGGVRAALGRAGAAADLRSALAVARSVGAAPAAGRAHAWKAAFGT